MHANTSPSRNRTHQIQATAKPRGVRKYALIRSSRDARNRGRIVPPWKFSSEEAQSSSDEPPKGSLVACVEALKNGIDGWQTSTGSKNVLVNCLREKLYYRQTGVHSQRLWEELRNFVKDLTPTLDQHFEAEYGLSVKAKSAVASL